LNEQGVPTPRAQRGRPSGWDQGTIRAVLERQLYRGVVEYGKTRKRDAWGRKKISARPSSDLIRLEKPELRIVSEQLAAAVDAIRTDRRQRYLRSNDGRLLGQPVLGKYALSGLLRCSCGANYEAQKAPHGWRRGDCYVCAAARRKGKAICDNRLAFPIAETEERILSTIENVVLTPSFIEVVLNTVFVPDAVDRPAIEAEIAELERQVTNLTTAIRMGGDLHSLVDELKATNVRLVSLRRRLDPHEQIDREQLRAALEQRVDDWKQVLRAHPAQARQVIAHLLGYIEIRPSDGAALKALVDAGIDLDDQTGKPLDGDCSEEDYREIADSMRQIAGMVVWTAQTRPAGLLAGMPQVLSFLRDR
jgi:site-specific DNA recombinase